MLPIVLQHGMFGFSDIRLGKLRISYFQGIDRALIERGHPLLVARVHPTSSIETRARQLKAQIIQFFRRSPGTPRRVVIIAHSMGGLDARYMITRLGMANRVATLVTLSTPHHGSPYADWCLQNLGRRLGGMKLARLLKLDIGALNDLTTGACAEFNKMHPDDPLVRYFSVSGARPWHLMPPIFMHSHKIISNHEGSNDGLVSVASATWGEHLGTWPADHLHMVNRRFRPEFIDRTGDVTGRYLHLIDQLRLRGIFDSPPVGACEK